MYLRFKKKILDGNKITANNSDFNYDNKYKIVIIIKAFETSVHVMTQYACVQLI